MEIECNVKYRWPLSLLLKPKKKKVKVKSVKNLMATLRKRKFVSKIRAKIAGGQKIIRG